MIRPERLERRLLACGWAPHAPGAGESPEGVTDPSPAVAAASVSPVGEPVYNTPFLTDAALEHVDMTAAEIRAFLVDRGSYFRQSVPDVDGIPFDAATVIASAAAQYRINPEVLLATLQKEHAGVTNPNRPTDARMRILMGCGTPSTARQQLACAAERFRSYHNSQVGGGVTVSGWRVGVAKTTQDGVTVTPASRAVTGQFTYTPYAGTQWGGNQPSVGGVWLFDNYWRVFGFTDAVRPVAASNPALYVARGAASLTFTVKYTDAEKVDRSDLFNNHNAVRVTGPNGFDQPATFVSVDNAGDGIERNATYRLASPGGTWDAADAGAYAIVMREAQVSDVNNNYVRPGQVGTLTVVPAATVVGRHVFYERSAFDGGIRGPGPSDDGAIAPDKVSLLPGRAASFANITSSSHGINGIMVDLRGHGPVLSSTDFAFRVGNNGDPSTWTPAPPPANIGLRLYAGGFGRVSFIWEERFEPKDGAVQNGWLQVTVKATANTRLATPDVFYFGNLAGGAAGDAFSVDGADVIATRSAIASGPATVANRFDHNRDGRVDLRDVVVARGNLGASLFPLGTAPLAGASDETAGAASRGASAMADDRRTRPRRAPYVLY